MRNPRLRCLAAVCGALLLASCSVTIQPQDSSVSFEIGGRRFTFSFGPVGIVDVVADQTVRQAGALRLFEERPAETPSGGTMRLLGTDVGVARMLNAKTVVQSQAIFGSGTATVRFSIAPGQSAALCDTATFLAEFDLVITAGSVSVVDEIFELSQQALAVIVQNDVTICIEVTADFDGQLSFTEFSLSFDGGAAGSAEFSLRNDDSENIHILLPGENFDASNRITPGSSRNATLQDLASGAVVSVRAGRNGTVLDSTTCPALTGVNYTAQVVWNGTSVTCAAEQDAGDTDPVVTPGATIQVPINALGLAVPPGDRFGGIDYGIVGVLDVNSSSSFPPNLASNVTPDYGELQIDLESLGLASVESIYLATAGAWIPDVPDGVTISTLTCAYAEGGSPTVVEMRTGSTTAEWSWERLEHQSQFGGVAHQRISILYSSPTNINSASVYDGHMFGVQVAMDSTRTLASCALSLTNPATYVGLRVPGTPPSNVTDWAGTAIVGMTLVGPALGGGGGDTGSGTISGQVVNAQTGEPLEGVRITVRESSVSTVSDASGMFSLQGAPAGTPVLVATLDGFVQTTQPVVLLPGATTQTSIGMLALGEGGDGIAAVLAWGETPRDLDLHMSGPVGDGGRFHAYFAMRTPVEHVFLDLDDTSAFGPETMTVSAGESGSFVPGEYTVWVHNFSGSPGFDESAATLTLYVQGVQRAQYTVGPASGDPAQNIWHVVSFTVNADGSVGGISQRQSFESGSSSSIF